MLYTCELVYDHVAKHWVVSFKRSNILFGESSVTVGYFETKDEMSLAVSLWCIKGKE